jgi:hypothetical protein
LIKFDQSLNIFVLLNLVVQQVLSHAMVREEQACEASKFPKQDAFSPRLILELVMNMGPKFTDCYNAHELSLYIAIAKIQTVCQALPSATDGIRPHQGGFPLSSISRANRPVGGGTHRNKALRYTR